MGSLTTENHTDAVVFAIESLINATGSRLVVGRGRRPINGGWQGEPDVTAFVPYVVLYPSTGAHDGTLADPTEYLVYTVQCNVVAASQEGVEHASDLIKKALADVPLSVLGRFSYRGQLLIDTPISRDDVLAPPVYFAVLQVRWRTQAA